MRTLRCYAEGRGDQWEAVCLDLDIAVQGDSFEAVFGDMNEAIVLYLETLQDLPEADRVRLMGRHAPLNLQLKFLWYAVLAALPATRPSDKARAEFLVPCPA